MHDLTLGTHMKHLAFHVSIPSSFRLFGILNLADGNIEVNGDVKDQNIPDSRYMMTGSSWYIASDIASSYSVIFYSMKGIHICKHPFG